jgi:hypothetical protein
LKVELSSKRGTQNLFKSQEKAKGCGVNLKVRKRRRMRIETSSPHGAKLENKMKIKE